MESRTLAVLFQLGFIVGVASWIPAHFYRWRLKQRHPELLHRIRTTHRGLRAFFQEKELLRLDPSDPADARSDKLKLKFWYYFSAASIFGGLFLGFLSKR